MVDVVDVKHNLKHDLVFYEIKEKIKQRLTQFPDYGRYKTDSEFLLLACNLIENLIKKSLKVNKKELCLTIYKEIFEMSEDDTKLVESNIEFLFNNKKFKKVSYYKLFMTGLSEWLKRKVL
jgi:hypothetical protein